VKPVIRGHVSRDALPVLDNLLQEEPAILLEGPRGSGKSTLLREIAAGRDATVVDLDDEAVIAFVQQDPTTALTHPGLVVVDEFQRAPAVLSVVKRIVDRSGEPGRFLLAGSVSARLLPTWSRDPDRTSPPDAAPPAVHSRNSRKRQQTATYATQRRRPRRRSLDLAPPGLFRIPGGRRLPSGACSPYPQFQAPLVR